MERTEPSTNHEPMTETIGDELDRLEIPAGKIGMITSAQAFALLHGLDSVYRRMQELDLDNPSRKVAEAQFDGIVARMRNEAGRFIRDLGGLQALRQARAEVKPPEDHWWWYLDEYLANKRQAAIKRSLIIAGAVVVALILLAVLYNRFLAPSPQVTAVYNHEQTANDLMMKGDLQGALDEVNAGLIVSPTDPTLLVMKGVIQDGLGQSDQAAQSFTAAKAGFTNPEDFYLTRGQNYLMINQPEKALADGQSALQANPQSPQAYLLIGQIYEVQQQFQPALDAYNKAYDAADKAKKPELAALARMRIAMLMQSQNSQQMMPSLEATPTP